MNRKIVIAAVVITASGVVNAYIGNRPITRVILGGYVFILVLSLMDMFGGALSQLSGALAMVAVLYIVLAQIPWNTIIGTVAGKK